MTVASRLWACSALLLPAVMAGCLGADGDGAPQPAETPAEDLGRLPVVVEAGAGPEAGAPLPQARLEADTGTVEGSAGRFNVTGVPPGPVNLTVESPGYRPANRTVSAPADDPVRIPLTPTPSQATLEGRYDCASATLIAAGDCLVLVDAAAGTAGLPVAPGDATDEQATFPLDLPPGWTRLDLRLTWTPANPSTEDLRLEVEPRDAPEGRSRTPDLAQATGPSPLELALRPGETGPGATVEEPAGNGTTEPVRLKVYPPGEARDAGGSGLLGASAAHDQPFRLDLRLTYHDPRGDPT